MHSCRLGILLGSWLLLLGSVQAQTPTLGNPTPVSNPMVAPAKSNPTPVPVGSVTTSSVNQRPKWDPNPLLLPIQRAQDPGPALPATQIPATFLDGSGVVTAPPPPKLWTGGVEFGLSGSEGNSQVLKIRLGNDLKRETADNIFTSNFFYGISKQQNVENENKALWNARDEILFGNSPWSAFVSSNLEYDKFRAFDFRIGVYGGAIYTFWKNETGFLKGRVGAGVQREIGGPEDQWVPEALFGFDTEYALTSRSKLTGNFDYYPSLEDLNQYRIRARAAYEVLVDPDLGLTLRLGMQDRFDSQPGPAKKNDLDYFATMVFKF
jgi:hypothetical protein